MVNEIIKNVLSKKQITIAQFLTFLIGLAMFIFMDTDYFKDMNSAIKIAFYIGLYGMCIIFGVELFQTKKLAMGIRNVILDRGLSLEEKIMEITQYVTEALIKLGEAWEVFDKEQFSPENIEKMTGQNIESSSEELIKKID